MKVRVYRHDPLLTLCESRQETIEMFGKEYLDEEGVEVPDSLVERAIRTKEELLEVSRLLETIRKGKV